MYIYILKMAQVVPEGFVLRLPYQEIIEKKTITNVSTNMSVWRLNSIYDPNSTGGGHQPLGHDLWAGVFGFYKVLSCKATVTVWCDLDATTVGGRRVSPIVVIQKGPSNSWATDYTTASESKMSSDLIILGHTQSDKNRFTYEFEYTPETFYNGDDPNNENDEWTAVGTNPVSTPFMNITAWTEDGATTCYYAQSVKLVYTVKFRQPLNNLDLVQN